MSDEEERLIIKKFGRDYSWWNIPAYIRKRDEMPKPDNPTVPYWKRIEYSIPFEGEKLCDYFDRLNFVEDPLGLELWNDIDG